MSIKDDLEQHCRESYRIISECKEILRSSSDPKEQTRMRRVIEEQQELVKGYLSEYALLCGRLHLSIPQDIAELAAAVGVQLPSTSTISLEHETSYVQSIPSAQSSTRQPQAAYSEELNLGILRELLLAAFTDRSLPRFCQERPLFNQVVHRFSSRGDLADMVDQVIEYCAEFHLWQELLAEVKGANPRQYARFESDLWR